MKKINLWDLSLCLGFLCLILISPSLGLADEQVEEITEVTLTESELVETSTIKVTATRSEKDLLDVPMSVSVITSEEIERRGSFDLVDILRSVPGIRVTDNTNSPAISIRGETPNQTVVLVDGVKVSSDYGVGEFGNQLPFIDPSLIERIEVIKGPASVLYGAEAMGGVVNIILKKGGTKPIQGSISTSYSSDRSASITTASIFGALNKFKYRLAGTYKNLGDLEYYHTDQEQTAREGGDGYVYLGYDFTDNLYAGLTYEYGNTQYQINENYAKEWTELTTNRVNADIIVKDITNFLPRVKATFSYHGSEYLTPDYLNGVLDEDGKTDIENFGFTFQSDWLIGEHTSIIAGYEFLHEKYDLNKRDSMTSTSTSAYSGPYTEVRQATGDTHAAFISVEHYLPYDFTLSYGARFTHYSDDTDGQYRNYWTGNTRQLGTKSSSTESAIVFNAGIVWTGIENLALRATFAQAFNPANFYNKYLEFQMNTSGTLWNIGDPDMKPEEMDTYEIGARYNNGKFNFDAALFYSKTKNRFDTIRYTDSGITYVQYLNVSDSTAWGLEFETSYKFDNGFEPYWNGTWQRRKDNISSGSAGADEIGLVDDLPIFSTTFGLRYYNEIYDNLFLNADIYAYHQTEYLGYDLVGFVTTNKVRPSYTTLNLSLGVEYGEEKNFFAQVNVNNIFDEEYYYTSAEDYAPGFNSTLTIGYRF